MKLYIVRHGETDANTNGVIQGWLDTELNETGLQQAGRVAQSFNHTVDAIYSSDLKRATQTASEFRKYSDSTPYFEDSRLRERSFGDATGGHRDAYDWDEFWKYNDTVTIPSAEVLNDFTARVADFLDELRKKSYSSVLIVTHGGVLNRIQTILDPNHQHSSHENASVLEIDI